MDSTDIVYYPPSFIDEFLPDDVKRRFEREPLTDREKQIIGHAFQLMNVWDKPLPGETDEREYMYQEPGKGINVMFWQNRLPMLLSERNMVDADWFFISSSVLTEPACEPTSIVYNGYGDFVPYVDYRADLIGHAADLLTGFIRKGDQMPIEVIRLVFDPTIMLQMYPVTLDSGERVFVNLWWKVYQIFIGGDYDYHVTEASDLTGFVNKVIDECVSRTVVNNPQIPAIVKAAIDAVSRNATDFIYMSRVSRYILSVIPGVNVYNYPDIGYLLGPKVVIRTQTRGLPSEKEIHVFTLLDPAYIVDSSVSPELEALMEVSQKYELTASMMETAAEMVKFLV